ncbi:MAG: M61 family metallopeptidase [Cyanobacteria bacterium NC_groundwater_1444_Ag_S-0.65um_54_12]|nr:M61 family metallopeptidase [Cyanobacteria bacterium NC_groundwater_1444_Ag_S-0.65um_54_12]
MVYPGGMQGYVHYQLWIDRPHTHRASVEITLPPLTGAVELAMPAWTPGAYKLVDHARNVRSLSVMSPTGEQLTVERLDLHRWLIPETVPGARVRYEVYADKLMIHQAQINAEHAFLNGGPLWLCVIPARCLPATVALHLPKEWQVATALTQISPGLYRADDYDALIDAPIEAGSFATAAVDAAGVRWEVAWHDTQTVNHLKTPSGLLPVTKGIAKIAAAAVKLFGTAPFTRYVCLFHECEEPGYLNGLEHAASLAIQGPLALASRPDAFFTMVAHEIFHAWNGRRLTPEGLGRNCDYWRPAHTTALWVVEGITEYYASLLCLRAGLLDQAAYLRQLGELITSYERMPGRHIATLAESSFITWNFGDDRWNSAVNYYVKGALTAWALDAEIREQTDNARSLDDLMRALWEKHGNAVPYQSATVETLAASIAGCSLDNFFDRQLRSTQEIDWSRTCRKLGLELRTRQNPALGISASGAPGALKIGKIEAYSPAEEAGLQANDVLVAISGLRASEELLADIGKLVIPGERLTMSYFRGDRLCAAELPVGSSTTFQVVPAARPSKSQTAILASYLEGGMAPALAPL